MRSFLFVPGHRASLHAKALASDADVVVFDLEDAVPPDEKPLARELVAQTLRAGTGGRGWIRIGPPATPAARADLEVLAPLADGIRIPKVETASSCWWVARRVPRGTPFICAIETALGVLNAREIAAVPGVTALSLGGLDLASDLGIHPSSPTMDAARVTLVTVSAALALQPPIDSVFGDLDDVDGLAQAAGHAKVLGFGGKSAIHPSQIRTINDAFSPSSEEIAWAARVLAAWNDSGGHPTTTDRGEFVDPPVARRAERIAAHR